MAFAELPQTAQNLLLQSFDSYSKNIWLFFLFVFSLIYLFYWKKYVEQETPYYSVGIIRIFITMFSYVFLIGSPLMFIIFKSPELSHWSVFNIFFTFYGIVLIIFSLMATIDLFRYFPFLLMKWMGIKQDDQNVNKVFRKIFGSRRFPK